MPAASAREPAADGPPLALWAGAECTLNRVGDRFHDQLVFGGHAARLDDLDRLAALGVRRLRHAILWERTAPDGLARADWGWGDRSMERLRALGVAPIVGLVHHGSGPRDTSLIDPAFPEKLAAYARAVAERYPDVDAWTPINEVVTTARFATLYGHWYPHTRDIRLCMRAVLNQCRGIVLAMRAIRAVNPRALLVQTEELGRIRSTPPLAYQAAYENHRAALALDLLCGRVDADHPMWRHLVGAGASAAELAAFREDPTSPDIIGVNYYVTSDRYLDHRLARYPAALHGGNGRDHYADVEAVRVLPGLIGHAALLTDLHRRYRLPLAITEAHLGCTREEQVRWLLEAWAGAEAARRAGADVRAVTAWAAFGAFHWDRLVTSLDGGYEPGLFDVRSGSPRPTALARVAAELARGATPAHPAAGGAGWWRRPIRTAYPPSERQEEVAPGAALLVTGGGGRLGRGIARIAARRGLPCRVLTRAALDITDAAAVRAEITASAPWAVLNAAAYVRVDAAERDPERCHRENVEGARNLAEVCAAHGLPLCTFSSHLVFNGAARERYREASAPDPLGVYGQSKARAEAVVLDLHPRALVVRSAAFFAPWDEGNFVRRTVTRLRAGQPVRAARDLVVSPTYVPDLIDAVLDLLLDQESGIWHLANDGETDWAALARTTARLARLDERLIEPCAANDLGQCAARPRYSPLGSERGSLLRPLEEALGACVAALEA